MSPWAYLELVCKQTQLFLPTLVKIADVIFVKFKRKIGTRLTASYSGKDIEVKYYEDRFGWLFDLYTEAGPQAVIDKFEEIVSSDDLCPDPYSCSQRIARTSYLAKLVPDLGLSKKLRGQLKKDASIVARHYEYRFFNTRFNNHLLNNYRALLLYLSYFSEPDEEKMLKNALGGIGAILKRNDQVLFAPTGMPLLSEGSVSYEIHGLKILVDLACCSVRTELADIYRQRIVDNGKNILLNYRTGNSWIVPHVGNVTPNWTEKTMLDFMNGFLFSDSISLYRKIWKKELKSLGL